MTVAPLLEQLDHLGVRLWREGDQLRYRSPKGALGEGLLAEMRRRKGEILRLLRDERPPIEQLPPLMPEPARRGEPFRPTDIQEAYLLGRTELFELGDIGPTSYVELDWQKLDLKRFEEAWQRLVHRHDVLRTVALADGRLQILETVPAVTIAFEDLSRENPDAVSARLAQLRREGSERFFNPQTWPLFEIKASKLADGRTRLHVSRDLMIGDVRSSAILFEELLHLYMGPGTELPALTLSVRDYAVALEKLRRHEAYARCRTYWEKRLETLPGAPELPLAAETQRSGARHRFVRRQVEIDPGLYEALRRQSSRFGLTPSSLLCAVFAEVLARWSNSRHFVLNVLYSHRLTLHPEVGRLVGNFASTILLEVDLAAGETFERRAVRLQERLWEDMGHGLVSGVEVLREINRRHGLSQRAAMPVVFSSVLPFTQEAASQSSAARRLEGGPFTTVFHNVQTPQVMLESLVTEGKGALLLAWNFVEGLFADGFVEAMFAAYVAQVRRLARDEQAWSLPFLELVPREQLERRHRVNQTAAPESGRLLHLLGGAPSPAETAVVDERRRLSYGDLERRADLLARELRRAGARPEALIAVVMEKGWEQVVAVLAILKAGAAYLPIDPTLPRERRFYLLEHGEAELAVTRPELFEGLEWPRRVRLFAVRDEPEDTDGSNALPPPSVGRDTLAYVIFTSGSTGLPKGVMIEHRGAANTVADVNRRFGLTARDRVLGLSSLSFDLSVWDIFGTLAAGGRLILPRAEAIRDPVHWHDLVLAEGVTVWNSVPALMEAYVELLESRGESLPASLRLVLLSGDWVPVTLPERIRALSPELRVISMGGATEASIWSIAHEIGEVDPAWASIPYGTPLANQRFHVLDDSLRPCPDGVVGPLYIGGAGLARGYWKDSEKTAASFVEHPVSGERLYRTGDLGRYLGDGAIELLGREDLQVKIQGYRIELGEIEAVLLRHPGVREAVVVAVGEPRGHKRLVAFVVGVEEGAPELGEVRAFLGGKLPEYMVPGVVVPLDEMPLTPNGKVDRQSLSRHRALRRASPRNAGETLSETQRRLAEIWEEVLESRNFGIEDSFFEAGGDSLLALRLLARMEKSFGRRLPLTAVFENGTIEHLAEVLETGDG